VGINIEQKLEMLTGEKVTEQLKQAGLGKAEDEDAQMAVAPFS
jgi:hypothetical protein